MNAVFSSIKNIEENRDLLVWRVQKKYSFWCEIINITDMHRYICVVRMFRCHFRCRFKALFLGQQMGHLMKWQGYRRLVMVFVSGLFNCTSCVKSTLWGLLYIFIKKKNSWLRFSVCIMHLGNTKHTNSPVVHQHCLRSGLSPTHSPLLHVVPSLSHIPCLSVLSHLKLINKEKERKHRHYAHTSCDWERSTQVKQLSGTAVVLFCPSHLSSSAPPHYLMVL